MTCKRLFSSQSCRVFDNENPSVCIDADLNDRAIDLTSNRMDLAVRIGYLHDSTLRVGFPHF